MDKYWFCSYNVLEFIGVCILLMHSRLVSSGNSLIDCFKFVCKQYLQHPYLSQSAGHLVQGAELVGNKKTQA